RVNRALATCDRDKGGRGDGRGAVDRARLSDAARSGDPGRRTRAGAAPTGCPGNRRGPIASGAFAIQRDGTWRFPLPPGPTSGFAEAARLHRARQIPWRRRAAPANRGPIAHACAIVATGSLESQPAIRWNPYWVQTLARSVSKLMQSSPAPRRDASRSRAARGLP